MEAVSEPAPPAVPKLKGVVPPAVCPKENEIPLAIKFIVAEPETMEAATALLLEPKVALPVPLLRTEMPSLAPAPTGVRNTPLPAAVMAICNPFPTAAGPVTNRPATELVPT